MITRDKLEQRIAALEMAEKQRRDILSVSHFYFLKNATTTAPGPAWVPITLPTVV